MITGESFCIETHARKSKNSDYTSYKAGWYDRENLTFADNREMSEIISEINKKLEEAEEYIRTLYRDLDIDNKGIYNGHDDPLGNSLCLFNHIKGNVREMAERFSVDLQMSLFYGYKKRK